MRPKIIGITGGIGSGKSIVARCLRVMGYPVYDADQRASQSLDSDPNVRMQVMQLLGAEAYSKEGKPNRTFISSKVFNAPQLLAGLNHILHPVVRKDFEDWVNAHHQHPIVFKEAAILFESGAYQQVDQVIAVTAPEQIRLVRVQKRDERSEQEIKSIMARQMDQEELVRRSDFEIINDDMTPVLPALIELLNQLKS